MKQAFQFLQAIIHDGHGSDCCKTVQVKEGIQTRIFGIDAQQPLVKEMIHLIDIIIDLHKAL